MYDLIQALEMSDEDLACYLDQLTYGEESLPDGLMTDAAHEIIEALLLEEDTVSDEELACYIDQLTHGEESLPVEVMEAMSKGLGEFIDQLTQGEEPLLCGFTTDAAREVKSQVKSSLCDELDAGLERLQKLAQDALNRHPLL